MNDQQQLAPKNPCVDHLPLEDYLADPAWSRGAIWTAFSRTPAHCQADLAEEAAATPAMVFGSAYHCFVLEPDLFGSRFAVAPVEDQRVKAFREWGGTIPVTSTIIRPSEYKRLTAMRDALLGNPIIRTLLSSGVAERSLFWTDKATGIDCKARLDYHRSDGAVIDLKTTFDASYQAFQRTAFGQGYHCQAAFYLAAAAAVFGQPEGSPFLVIAQEPTAPYAHAIYAPDADFIREGRKAWTNGLAVIAECIKSNDWPGYPGEILDLSMPAWAS